MPVLAALTLLAGSTFISPTAAVAADGAVTVDGTSDLGPATFVASGFLHNDAVDPALAHALKPQSWRTAGYWGMAGSNYDRARIHGAKVMWLLSDDWDLSTRSYQPWLDWEGYEAFVRWTVKKHLREFPVEWWDIQNEPEYFAPEGGSREQLLEMYKRAYDAIHAGYAEFVAEEGGFTDVPPPKIVAPSISGFRRSPIDLDGFLDFAAANDMRLQGIAWHELCSAGPPDECPVSPYDIDDHVSSARQKIAARGPVLAGAEPMINEYIRPGVEDVPGQVAGHVAAIDRSNVVQANHTCWPEPSGGESCFEPRLNGLVMKDGRTPRSSYWVYKAYADMVGTRLATTVPTMPTTPPTAAAKPFSAHATHDAANEEIRVLLGRHETQCSSAPNFWCAPVTNAGVPAPKSVSVAVKVPWDAGSVTVRRQKLARPSENHSPNTSGFQPAAPTPLNLPVSNGIVTVPIEAFGDGEAWSIVIDALRPADVPLPPLSAPVPDVPTHFCAVETCVPSGPIGSWSSTGSIYFGLSRSETARLADGRVLQTGGFAHSASQNTARIYDHVTGTWNVSAPMRLTRLAHSLTTLPDGRVLAAGGETFGEVRGSAETYDPATEAWELTGNLVTPRYDHTATALPDGRLLVTGGWVRQVTYAESTGTAEIYDPATRTWTATGSLVMPRAGATASLLPDGKVLVAGGSPGPGLALPTAEVWDPATGLFTLTGPLATPRSYQTASTLADGSVLIAGGGTVLFQSEQNAFETNITATAEIYDPATRAWRPAGDIPGSARTRHTASTLDDGRVLFSGGVGVDGSHLASTAVYDDGTWSTAERMSTPRAFHTATTLPNGNVLVAGGEHSAAKDVTKLGRYEFMKILSSAEVFLTTAPDDVPPVVPEAPGGAATLLPLAAAVGLLALVVRRRTVAPRTRRRRPART